MTSAAPAAPTFPAALEAALRPATKHHHLICGYFDGAPLGRPHRVEIASWLQSGPAIAWRDRIQADLLGPNVLAPSPEEASDIVRLFTSPALRFASDQALLHTVRTTAAAALWIERW